MGAGLLRGIRAAHDPRRQGTLPAQERSHGGVPEEFFENGNGRTIPVVDWVVQLGDVWSSNQQEATILKKSLGTETAATSLQERSKGNALLAPPRAGANEVLPTERGRRKKQLKTRK